MGSGIADLDRLVERGRGSRGTVVEWQSASSGKGRPIKNEFGEFIAVDRGDYDRWSGSPAYSTDFSGEITFIHDGSTSADANVLTYVKGKLRKKDWGFLPG